MSKEMFSVIVRLTTTKGKIIMLFKMGKIKMKI